MIGRIVEVADDRRHLFVSRGFMVVQDTEGERKELGKVPLDDIAAVIANADPVEYTAPPLTAVKLAFVPPLANATCPVIIEAGTAKGVVCFT